MGTQQLSARSVRRINRLVAANPENGAPGSQAFVCAFTTPDPQSVVVFAANGASSIVDRRTGRVRPDVNARWHETLFPQRKVPDA